MDASTRLYGVIGQPISGSRSPWIHNTVFQETGVNAGYMAFEVAPENLRDAINGFRAIGAGGLNVTIPHKTAVMELLDEIDPYAQALGAVNVIAFRDGKTIGFNTDGPGLVHVLLKKESNLASKKVLVLGAGGASRGICGALLNAGVSVLGIWNRTSERAESLVQGLRGFTEAVLDVHCVSDTRSFCEYDVVINTTSVGMQPDVEIIPVAVELLKSGCLICDIVYKPHETRWIREAIAAGHPVVYGIEMLIEQALLAQQIWIGQTDETIDRLRTILYEQLRSSI